MREIASESTVKWRAAPESAGRATEARAMAQIARKTAYRSLRLAYPRLDRFDASGSEHIRRVEMPL